MWLGWPGTYVPPKYESTGIGTVVFYDSSTRQLLHENDRGYQKMLSPVCQKQLPAWSHMRVNIMYRWAPYQRWTSGRGPDAGEECYEIYAIQRLDLGKEHPYEVVGHLQ